MDIGTCNSPRYASHLLPITFPHEKHRIGMIIFCKRKENVSFLGTKSPNSNDHDMQKDALFSVVEAPKKGAKRTDASGAYT